MTTGTGDYCDFNGQETPVIFCPNSIKYQTRCMRKHIRDTWTDASVPYGVRVDNTLLDEHDLVLSFHPTIPQGAYYDALAVSLTIPYGGSRVVPFCMPGYTSSYNFSNGGPDDDDEGQFACGTTTQVTHYPVFPGSQAAMRRAEFRGTPFNAVTLTGVPAGKNTIEIDGGDDVASVTRVEEGANVTFHMDSFNTPVVGDALTLSNDTGSLTQTIVQETPGFFESYTVSRGGVVTTGGILTTGAGDYCDFNGRYTPAVFCPRSIAHQTRCYRRHAADSRAGYGVRVDNKLLDGHSVVVSFRQCLPCLDAVWGDCDDSFKVSRTIPYGSSRVVPLCLMVPELSSLYHFLGNTGPAGKVSCATTTSVADYPVFPGREFQSCVEFEGSDGVTMTTSPTGKNTFEVDGEDVGSVVHVEGSKNVCLHMASCKDAVPVVGEALTLRNAAGGTLVQTIVQAVPRFFEYYTAVRGGDTSSGDILTTGTGDDYCEYNGESIPNVFCPHSIAHQTPCPHKHVVDPRGRYGVRILNTLADNVKVTFSQCMGPGADAD
ncbi:MAG: hypothetical protein GY851_00535, partial [bacterium]|nr:hypothetical protein [bacterium]